MKDDSGLLKALAYRMRLALGIYCLPINAGIGQGFG